MKTEIHFFKNVLFGHVHAAIAHFDSLKTDEYIYLGSRLVDVPDREPTIEEQIAGNEYHAGKAKPKYKHLFTDEADRLRKSLEQVA